MITLLALTVCVVYIAHLQCMTVLVLHLYSLLEIQFLRLNVIKCAFFLHAQRQSSVICSNLYFMQSLNKYAIELA